MYCQHIRAVLRFHSTFEVPVGWVLVWVTESVCGLGGVFYGKQHGWHSWVCDGYEVIRIAHEYYFLPWSPEW